MKLDDAQKVRKIRKLIKEFRNSEADERVFATSRSTGIRNVYRSGYKKLEAIEEVLKS